MRMGNTQKVSGAFIYVLCLEKTLRVFGKMLLAKQKHLVLVLIQEYLLGN